MLNLALKCSVFLLYSVDKWMGEFSADEGRCYLDASYDRFPKISLSYCPKEQRKAEKVIPSVQSGSVTPTL